MFAPSTAEYHPLKIAQFSAWRVKEPVSNRRYTVVRLQSQGGVWGYGEGGPATAAEIVAARAATVDRRATESEFIRSALHRTPALEAAVNNAMLDLVSRAKNVPIYQYLGGPVRYKARLLGHLEGSGPADSAPSLERAKRQGIQAFTTAAPLRDAMIPLRAYVDLVRKQYAEMQKLAGPSSEWVLDAAGAMTPGDAATIAVALESSHPIWFDEPTAVTSPDSLAKIVDESVISRSCGDSLCGNRALPQRRPNRLDGRHSSERLASLRLRPADSRARFRSRRRHARRDYFRSEGSRGQRICRFGQSSR